MPKGSRRAARAAEARRALRSGDDEAPASPTGSPLPAGERVEGDFAVRRVSGAGATKAYRCPGCEQEVRPGTPHVVAWPLGSPDDRRHWHTPCWDARGRRAPKVQRSRDAPRYG